MLTREILKANDTTKALEPGIVDALVELSQNLTNERIGRFWSDLDRDIAGATGKAKPAGMKTHEWMKQEFGALKEAATNGPAELQKQLEALQADKAELEKQIKGGKGAEALTKKIESLERAAKDKADRIGALEAQLKEAKETHDQALAKATGEAMDLQVDHQFSTSLVGVEFKPGIPEEAIKATIAAGKMAVRAMGKPEPYQLADGSENIVLRNEAGVVIPNPEDLSRPFTVGSLLLKQLQPIIKDGAGGAGGGTGKPGGGTTGGALDLTGVKTKVEADRIIRKHLTDQGIAVNSDAYKEQHAALRKENGVGELPIK